MQFLPHYGAHFNFKQKIQTVDIIRGRKGQALSRTLFSIETFTFLYIIYITKRNYCLIFVPTKISFHVTNNTRKNE